MCRKDRKLFKGVIFAYVIAELDSIVSGGVTQSGQSATLTLFNVEARLIRLSDEAQADD